MILFASNDWREPSLGFFGDPDGSYFAMIEITLHVPLFIVDVMVVYEDEPDASRWKQYLQPSFNSVMGFLKNIGDAEHEVSILMPKNRFPDNERVVGTVVEVQAGVDREHGAQAVVYTLADGRRILDAHIASSENELEKLETIYRKEKLVPSRECNDDLT